MRSRSADLALAILLSLTAAYGDVDDPAAVEDDAIHVTYVSGNSIYVAAGREKGVAEGDELRVLREGEVFSVLRVAALSARRSSCIVVEGYPFPEAGDLVELEVHEGLPMVARISHIDKGTVFVDSGSDVDLHGGDRLGVLRGGQVVATLEVTDTSKDLSACKIIDGETTLEAGQVVRLPERAGVPSGSVLSASLGVPLPGEVDADDEPRVRSKKSEARVYGRVGVRYLTVRDHTIASGDLSQPAFDLRLDASDMAGKHMDVAVDVRSRRTYRTEIDASGEVTDQTRVYRVSAAVHDPESRYRFSVGRQYSPSLAAVSTFDGVLFDYDGDRWSSGVFAGTQPAAEDYGYSDEIKEYGAFVQTHNRKSRQQPWSLTLGAVGSYQLGEINREFAYLQALYAGRRVTFYATEEVDYNRDWKLDLGEDRVVPSNSYVHMSVRAGGGFTLRMGYDNRRNIRLYRDFITPAVEFDDTFRRGAWVGFTQKIHKRFRFGLDAKQSRSETAGDADNYTLTLGMSGVSKANLSTHYRGTYYSNDTVEGRLHSLNASVSMTRHVRWILTAGLREDTNLVDPSLESRLTWYGAEVDFNLGRHWFLQLSSERNEGDNEGNDQSYLSMMYRF